jgi:hypothetical protein
MAGDLNLYAALMTGGKILLLLGALVTWRWWLRN